MYLSFTLDAESRARLLANVPATFLKVIAHHVTLIFVKTRQDEQAACAQLALANAGAYSPKVTVTGRLDGDHVQAVTVTVDGHADRPDGSFYHVTVSLEPPAKPVDSNKLRNPVPIAPFNLTGKIELLN